MNIRKDEYFYGDKEPLLEVESENFDYKKYEIKVIEGHEFITGIDEFGYDFDKKSKNTIAFLEDVLSIVDLSNKPNHILNWNEAEKHINKTRLCKLCNKYGWIVDLEKQNTYTREKLKSEKNIDIIYPTLIHGVRVKDIYKRIIILSLLDRLIPFIKEGNISDADIYSALLFQYFDSLETDIDSVNDADYPLNIILKENCSQYDECKKLYDKYSPELKEVIDKCMVVYNEMVIYNGKAVYENEINTEDKDHYGLNYIKLNLTNKNILDDRINDILDYSYPHLVRSNREKIYLYFSKYYKYYDLITDIQGFEDFFSRYKKLNDIDKKKLLTFYIEKIINEELMNVKRKFSFPNNISDQCNDAISHAYYNFTELLSNQAIGHSSVRPCPTCKAGVIIGNTNKKTCSFCNRKKLHQMKKKEIVHRYKSGATIEELKNAFNEGVFETSPESIEKWIRNIKNE